MTPDPLCNDPLYDLASLGWDDVVDTPGLRSVGLTDVSESLDLVFAAVEELGERCRFADCGHDSELAAPSDARLRSEERARWRRVTKERRRPERGTSGGGARL